eukprot:353839-Chlamydomonas_euryale.AAC.3
MPARVDSTDIYKDGAAYVQQERCRVEFWSVQHSWTRSLLLRRARETAACELQEYAYCMRVGRGEFKQLSSDCRTRHVGRADACGASSAACPVATGLGHSCASHASPLPHTVAFRSTPRGLGSF